VCQTGRGNKKDGGVPQTRVKKPRYPQEGRPWRPVGGNHTKTAADQGLA